MSVITQRDGTAIRARDVGNVQVAAYLNKLILIYLIQYNRHLLIVFTAFNNNLRFLLLLKTHFIHSVEDQKNQSIDFLKISIFYDSEFRRFEVLKIL